MPTAGAADGNSQITLSLALEIGKSRPNEIGEAREEFAEG